MLDVITWENAAENRDKLRSFAELRYEIFVNRLGWNLDCEEGNEQDQFDGDEAIYLTVSNSRGCVVGGARLLETTGPNLLCDVFPHLVEGEIPVGRNVYDVTRFAVDYRRDRVEGCGNIAQELLCGIMEFSVAARAPRLLSVSDIRIEPLLRRAGYRSRRLGPTIEMEGTGVAGLVHEVSPAILADCRRRTGLTHSVLNYVTKEAA